MIPRSREENYLYFKPNGKSSPYHFIRKYISPLIESGILKYKIIKHKNSRKQKIFQAQAMIDHNHMMVKIQPKISVSGFMGYLKEKSSLMIFGRHENLKYKYRTEISGRKDTLCRQ